jgi:hypothetical protein
VKNRVESAYHRTHASRCSVIDLTELNNSKGCAGDSFIKFVEETAKATKNKATDLISASMLKEETATKKLAQGKIVTTGLRVCDEGYYVGKFALDIIKQTRGTKIN